MAEYGHEELMGMIQQSGGVESLGNLMGGPAMASLNIPAATPEPAAPGPAAPQNWLNMGLK
ncbi:MAG: hypothetical protein KKA05_02210 [Alphaproteobacteria bacterium]|nr:hypothetical protein [Alphaproteobacteria bacterium]MBU0859633.1 hypothetical protein [Alphaproteobacteria bacterium]